MTKSKLESLHVFSLHFYIIVHHQRKSRQELKQAGKLGAAANAEATEGCVYWLSPQLASLENPKGPAHNGMGPPHQLLMKEMPYQPAYRSY